MRILFSYRNYGTGGVDMETGKLFYWLHEFIETPDFQHKWIKTRVLYNEGDKRLD